MPVVTIEAPPGIRHDAKKRMMDKVTAAVDEAYGWIASKGGSEILVFLHETAPENAALRTRDFAGLQSENPRFLEDAKKMKA